MAFLKSYQLLHTQRQVIIPLFFKCHIKGTKITFIALIPINKSLILQVSPSSLFFIASYSFVQRGICNTFYGILEKPRSPVTYKSISLGSFAQLMNLWLYGKFSYKILRLLPAIPTKVMSSRSYFCMSLCSSLTAEVEGVLIQTLMGILGNFQNTSSRVGMLSAFDFTVLISSVKCSYTQLCILGRFLWSTEVIFSFKPQVRSNVLSWWTTKTLSFVSHMSISSISEYWQPYQKAGIVFYTFYLEPPRCAILNILPESKQFWKREEEYVCFLWRRVGKANKRALEAKQLEKAIFSIVGSMLNISNKSLIEYCYYCCKFQKE